MNIREESELLSGVLVAGVVHTRFILRPATLADTYRAAEVVPVPDNLADDKSAKVAYQMAVDDAMILCQIETLGTLEPVPSPQALVTELDPDDMEVLRQAAYRLKKKWRASRTPSLPTAAPSSSSSPPDSP
jgi:hypothetical protein